jgi:spermidine synthase
VSTTTSITEVRVLSTTGTEQAAASTGRAWYFSFFFVSGFCSILYELIWLRLAMAQFGVTTAMISIVLSTFMAGLGIGSGAAGYFLRKYAHRVGSPPLHLYAVVELFIGCSAVAVPLELLAGRFLLEHLGSSLALSSSGYYIAAGLWMAFSLVPWCACMGATIPLGMFAVRNDPSLESKRSFSFLYLANVIGAVAGALLPLLWIEFFGFTSTLRFGMVLNLMICGAAMVLGRRQAAQVREHGEQIADGEIGPSSPQAAGSSMLWLLFATGLTSMGMEVVWTRQFTPFVGTLVYSFAGILATYLAATFAGSTIYWIWGRRRTHEAAMVWLWVWAASLIPLAAADSRLEIAAMLRVPLGIAAFSGLLGFLTPMLVDRFAQGDPNRAGTAYAFNVAGCIAGPLIAGFGLLPYFDERYALVILALPWLLIALAVALLHRPESASRNRFTARRALVSGVVLCASFALVFGTHSYVDQFSDAVVRRDSTATVFAAGQGMQKVLVVNGMNMTVLTPVTKLIASLPLVFLNHPPQNALVICFGMGTTHRSMLSWGIDSTAVDLVPSVPSLFSYYHADGVDLLKSPRSHIVIDDGRRFLERTTAQYDVIVIDPPPPIAAAGSSLLYSREFYTLAKKRLRPDGILQQWFPGGDEMTTAAIARSLKESFPYVRAFPSIADWGIHYLASRQPIPFLSASDLAKRMPPQAAADLVEWGPYPTAEQQWQAVLGKEVPISQILARDVFAPAVQDDRPINEYNELRKLGAWLYKGAWNPPLDPER